MQPLFCEPIKSRFLPICIPQCTFITALLVCRQYLDLLIKTLINCAAGSWKNSCVPLKKKS